jgi:hypothetical protein
MGAVFHTRADAVHVLRRRGQRAECGSCGHRPHRQRRQEVRPGELRPVLCDVQLHEEASSFCGVFGQDSCYCGVAHWRAVLRRLDSPGHSSVAAVVSPSEKRAETTGNMYSARLAAGCEVWRNFLYRRMRPPPLSSSSSSSSTTPSCAALCDSCASLCLAVGTARRCRRRRNRHGSFVHSFVRSFVYFIRAFVHFPIWSLPRRSFLDGACALLFPPYTQLRCLVRFACVTVRRRWHRAPLPASPQPPWFIRAFVRSFVHSFVYSLHSCIRSFVRSFISPSGRSRAVRSAMDSSSTHLPLSVSLPLPELDL